MQNTWAEECANCIELQEACNGALVACNLVTETQDGIMEIQAMELDLQAKRISELESDQNSLWNNTLIWFIVGAAAGTVGGVLLTK